MRERKDGKGRGGIKMIGLVFGLVLGFIVYETFAIIKKDNAN